MVLLPDEHFCDTRVRTPTNIVKCGFEGSETWPGRSKIEAGAAQSWKKTTNMSQKSTKTFKNQPRAKKRRPRAKNVPTWPQHGAIVGQALSILEGPGLPQEFPNRVSEGKNAVGSNTPGAASSEADLEAQEDPQSSSKA